MAQEQTATGFRIWAVDDVVYGPVELPTLVGWVKEKRVTEDTWVFSEKDDCWRKAKSVPELLMFFSTRPSRSPEKQPAGDPGVSDETALFAKKPSSLRRVKIFAEFADAQ